MQKDETQNYSENSPPLVPKEKFIANYELNGYSYDSFWQGRDYEHAAEMMLLNKVITQYIKNPEDKNIIDLAGAYGRLSPLYRDRFKEFIIADYSTRELSKGGNDLKDYADKMTLVALNVYKLPFPGQSVDTILCNRLIHHIATPSILFGEIQRVLKPEGMCILEVAHKQHAMSFIKSLFTGKLNEFYSDEPRRINHNPTDSQGISEGQVSIIYSFTTKHIDRLAKEHNLEIIEKRACSFLRIGILKKVLPIKLLLSLESLLQSVFAHFYVTPSVIYILKKPEGAAQNGSIKEFICPSCKGNLEQHENIIKCQSCSKEFTFVNNKIYDFRDPRPEEVNF